MFYIHEILTSRKHGVATIWLVATMGQKSVLKKVGRKAILDVNIPEACQSIVRPELPMALRLQSSLLSGVTRVYSQQCSYTLADVQQLHCNMRDLFRKARSSELTSNSGKIDPRQLMLEDDPTFVPDLDGPSFDLNVLLESSSSLGPSQQSSVFTPMGPQSHGSSNTSGGPVGGLILLPDSSPGLSGERYSVQGDLGPGSSRVSHQYSALGQADDVFLQDPNIASGLDHYLLSLDPAFLQSEAGITSARREQHQDDGIGIPFGDIMDLELPIAEDEPPAAAETFESATPTTPQQPTSDPYVHLHSPAAEAPAQRKSRTQKAIPSDQTIELKSTDLIAWNRDYIQNMLSQRQTKAHNKERVQARKNAEWLVTGRGIGNVGDGVGLGHIKSPLDIFSGACLLEMITGQTPADGHKRSRSPDSDPGSDERARRVRPRPGSDGHEPPADDGAGFFGGGGEDVETARRAGSGIDDHPSSAMPWNASASVRDSSISRGRSAGQRSASGPPGAARSRSRLVSASPLLRHSLAAHDLGGAGTDDFLLLDSDNDGAGVAGGPFARASSDFETWGPAAAVDTQTADGSQWVRDALDGEGRNFLAFVEHAARERRGARGEEEEEEEEGEDAGGVVTFEELLPAHANSRVVAAQALLHVLALGTKGLLAVRQERHFGDIELRVVVGGGGGTV